MWWLLSLAHASTFTPFQGTATAAQVDKIYAFLLVTSLISFILLIGGMIYFVVKYRRRSGNDKTAYITHNHTLEFLWSFIPFLIFMFVFAWGWIVYHDMRTVPENALEVHVYAKKWSWRFVYKNGKEVINDVDADGSTLPATMVVPQGRPVKLIMSSEKIAPAGNDPLDRPVLHSFYIPAFRVKQDLVPGRYTMLWFDAKEKGNFHVFCAEYCGSGHSGMMAMIKVVAPEEFDAWLSGEAAPGVVPAGGPAVSPIVAQGKQLYLNKACVGCHNLNGAPGATGPTFKGLFGREEKIQEGGTVKVDENYIRESILNPTAKTVAGFPKGAMPAFAGQLSEDEITAIIEFIKTIK